MTRETAERMLDRIRRRLNTCEFLDTDNEAVAIIEAALVSARADGERDMREKAAKCAELRMFVFGGEPTTRNEQQIVEHIAAAIRAIQEGEG